MNKSLKTIGSYLFLIFITYTLISNMGFIWKIFDYSFVNMTKNGNELVYKGNVIAIIPSDCVISYSQGLEEIDVSCPNNSKRWLKGVLIHN